jgi:hypothetical protein
MSWRNFVVLFGAIGPDGVIVDVYVQEIT